MREAQRAVGIVAALLVAGIHIYLIPDHLEEKFYIGILFAIGSALLLAAVTAMSFEPSAPAGWWLGGLVSAGMFIGYVLSRTSGLPEGYKEGWADPYGIASLVLELVFLVAAAGALSRRPTLHRAAA